MKGWDRRELVLLTRQLSTLIGSGTPMDRCLETLSRQTKDPFLREVMEEVQKKVLGGHSLSQVLARWPAIFSPFYQAMIRTGEVTGQLDLALERLSNSLEKDLDISQKVHSALMYPIFILALTGALTTLVFTTVIPGFVEIFRSSGLTLPLPTRILIFTADLIQMPGTWIALGALAFEVFWLKANLHRRPNWQLRWDRFLLGVPILGRLLLLSCNYRFAQSMETMLTCGMALDRSLLVAGEGSGNRAFVSVLKEGVERVREGQNLSRHLLAHPEVYSAMLAQLVVVGEETACLDQVLSRVAVELENELDHQIGILSAALEPLLLLVVASLVAFIVMAIFLPLYGSLDGLAGS